jgi:hypothetical protein
VPPAEIKPSFKNIGALAKSPVRAAVSLGVRGPQWWSERVVVNLDSLAGFHQRLSDVFLPRNGPFHYASHDFGFEIHERRELTTV